MKKLIDQKGTAAVEFAIVLPFLMAIVFGIIDFSLLLYDKQVITNASREGARLGIVSPSGSGPGGPARKTDAEIIAAVQLYANNNLVSFSGVKTVAFPPSTITRTGTLFGDNLTVTVQYNYQFLALPKFISGLTGVQNLSAQR
ncbi:MAG TPA: TadE/TadG family type IV pilus assembly protein [Candidatus Brocadiaceae bacterium]